ncbi:hypothetical protein FN846DRAFT_632253 [Sphaerosporella brunnea]|uniref:Leucine-rich repeat-containing protein 40 n=1 Tax=Sphaerosporella brunnea TaxID=1250544 RepID=A0A5J5F086_9PEZI|nr:hypothetical protein FN846DRAFT_632253 [Sphaerosporella brunnea]
MGLPGSSTRGRHTSIWETVYRNYGGATASSLAKSQPRRVPSNASLSTTSTTSTPTPPLKGRVSHNNLKKPATINTQLARKPSGSLASTPSQSPSLPTTPRVSSKRASDTNGTSPLNRRVSNTQLKQPTPTVSKRNSMTQISSKNLAHHGASGEANPAPARRQSSFGLPTAPVAPRSPSGSSKTIRASQAAPKVAARAPKRPIKATPTEEPLSPKKATSQSLRDTIRQARAAKQRVASVSNGEGNGLDGFDFGTADPFGQAIMGEGGSTKVLQQRIKSARVEGRLNISVLQLKEIPAAVYTMYESTDEDLAATDGDGPKWYESVDLTKLIGADNEISEIGEELATQFGALSAIDMHNNLLTSLPSNLSQLAELASLNLAGNELKNDALEVIFKITSLKDLKLGKNNFEGELNDSLSNLVALESLELQDNKLTSLPPSIGECSRLRVLSLARNALANLPIEDLLKCPLQDLDLSQNSLSGTFFPASVERWESLQSLNINSNHISSFAEHGAAVALPALIQLFASNNQLAAFPVLEGWDELLVLVLDQNRIDKLPDDLFNLRRLRTLDFSGNNVKSIDPRLSAIDSLEVINFAGNPLLDRKLAGMCAADLKKTLRGRLAPPEIVIAEIDDEPAMSRPGTSGYPSDDAPKTYEIGRGGVLELANKGLSDSDIAEIVDNIVGSPYTILLSQNSLTTIPSALDTFASLSVVDLSKNKLSPSSYLPDKLVLRSLETLNLHSTGIIDLDQLFSHLDAPKLQTLDVSANRISSIEGLRQAFPNLLNLHAADNQIVEIPVESIDGIRCLDLTGNSIGALPPQLALCKGLRELRVQGNLFRVPRWQVLEKGTEAVLAWLRPRLPQDEEEGAGLLDVLD